MTNAVPQRSWTRAAARNPVMGGEPMASPSPDLSGLTAADAEVFEQMAASKRAAAEGTNPLYRVQEEAEAAGLDALARALRDPAARGMPALRQGRGGETAPGDDADLPWRCRAVAQAVGATPTALAADGTLARLGLARDADVLTTAVETAQDAGAVTAMQKMIAHQLAAAHPVCMQLLSLAVGEAQKHRSAAHLNLGALAEAARTATAAARLMDSFTRGALALDRLQNGGRQTVTVIQRVEVADGGQAVVAGSMATGRRRNGARGGEPK